jgi:superfamily II DNA/RNA helicase
VLLAGKTLAFLLPVLQYLLERRDDETMSNDRTLQALILAPTRELAMQIHRECSDLVPGQIGTIVGGLAMSKQQRVLQKNRPPIIVGTVGRIWELVSHFI